MLTGVKPDSQQAARSSSKDAPGDVEPHAKHQQGQQQMHDGIMTFVYSADDTDRGSIKVFDTQDAA
jgi:hypothetical protein